MHLEKRVPHGAFFNKVSFAWPSHGSPPQILLDEHAGAGLGGGSANAATTLWAANALAGRPATDAQLLEWAGAIGSDISVFFSRGAAYCTGRCIASLVPAEAPIPTACNFGWCL